MVCGTQRYVPRSKSLMIQNGLSPTINVWPETIVKQKHENIYGMKWVDMCLAVAQFYFVSF